MGFFFTNRYIGVDTNKIQLKFWESSFEIFRVSECNAFRLPLVLYKMIDIVQFFFFLNTILFHLNTSFYGKRKASFAIN